MKSKFQSGFSLIETLIVVVIIGILAAIAIPSYLHAKITAENRAAVAVLSVIRSAQASFYAQNGRYARLDELQQSQNGSLGGDWSSATSNRRGSFTYTLTDPVSASDVDLKDGYTIIAARDNDTPTPYFYTLDQSGAIVVIEGL